MSQSPTQTNNPSPPALALDRLAPLHRQVGIAVGVAGLLLAVIPIYVYARYESLAAVWPVFAWGVAVSLVTLGHAAYFLFFMEGEGRPGQMTQTERFRACLVSLGGLLGALTALLGFVLPFTNYSEVFTGDLKVWRQNPRALAVTGLALFGGLTLIFVTFQLARGVQRSSVVMRRFLYLYNAVFSSLLLLFILVLFNLLAVSHVGAFNFFTTNFDWTSSAVYTLSPKSKALLASLDQPVKVYVIMNVGDRVTRDVETLLENSRSVTDKISYEELSPNRNLSDVRALLKKYPENDPIGLLVVYGTEPNTVWQYVKADELAKEQPFNPRPGASQPPPTFTGENALMKTIDYLSQGKTKAVIYFTQGNGEPDLNERRGDTPDKGLGLLAERIGKGNYEVKPLRFDADFKGVPDDADAVVVVHPGTVTAPMPEVGVRALRDYLVGAGGRKKGKLMVLLDVMVQTNGSMARSGLEELLEEYGVKAGNNRLLSARVKNPVQLLVEVNDASRNPVAQVFAGQDVPFVFDDARSVEPKQAEPGGRYTAEVLMQTVPAMLTWAEKDLTAQPAALAEQLLKNRVKLFETVSKTPIPVAVAVSESKGPGAMPPGHPPVGGDQQPRLLVFGDASWVTNQLLQNSQFNYMLFSNCLSWLRERPDIGTEYAEGKVRPEYTLNATPDTVSRLRWLPVGLMMLALVGLGGAVWVVRRR
jgi:hypothetical protein